MFSSYSDLPVLTFSKQNNNNNNEAVPKSFQETFFFDKITKFTTQFYSVQHSFSANVVIPDNNLHIGRAQMLNMHLFYSTLNNTVL